MLLCSIDSPNPVFKITDIGLSKLVDLLWHSSVPSLRGKKENETSENGIDVAPEANSQPGEDKEKNDVSSLDEAVKELNANLTAENQKLHQLNTSLNEKNHLLQLKNAELTENNAGETSKCEELENKYDDVSYELNKFRARKEKLETLLVETQSELQRLQRLSLCLALKESLWMSCRETWRIRRSWQPTDWWSKATTRGSEVWVVYKSSSFLFIKHHHIILFFE